MDLKPTFSVDHVFDLFQPVGFDVVTDALHGFFDVADLDLLFVLLVKRLERRLRSCQSIQYWLSRLEAILEKMYVFRLI